MERAFFFFGFLAVVLHLGFGRPALAHEDEDEMTGQRGAYVGHEFPEFFDIKANLEQAIGFYTNGRLTQADALADEGVGFVKILRLRPRNYGAREMIGLIVELGAFMKAQFPDGERLQVGDISGQRGGRLAKHSSHQNGLDADFGYFRVDRTEQDPQVLGGFEESMVSRGKVTENFDYVRNWAAFEFLVRSGWTTRIFVDAAIKKAMCKWSRENIQSADREEVLRRLRPYRFHDDHMHVRIQCPMTSPRCQNQGDMGPAIGC